MEKHIHPCIVESILKLLQNIIFEYITQKKKEKKWYRMSSSSSRHIDKNTIYKNSLLRIHTLRIRLELSFSLSLRGRN